MEYVTLVEALVLVSNEHCNFNVQQAFLQGVSSPVCSQFRSLESAISSPAAFMNYIGVDNEATGGDVEKFGENRGQLAFCIQV